MSTAPSPGTPADRPMAQIDGEPMVLPGDAPATLTDALVRAAASAGDRGTTYVPADDSEDRQTYRDLLADAARVLPGLRDAGLRPADSVLLHCDDNRNFVTGFWACLLGGFVPTPIGVAPTYQWDNATTRRMHGAWELLDRPPVLTDAALAPQVAGLGVLWETTALRTLAIEDLRAPEPTGDLYRGSPGEPAVHLLTSGSTGVPKCVRHSHRTVITRAYANAMVNGFGADDVTLNFMPLDHVAGMVMHNLRDVILMCEHVNARTGSFIADPLRWLTWIERYRATNTSAPNFVITLVTRLAGEIARRRWDLSSLRDITNGGEAIVSHTMHEFLHLLAPHGLAPDVMRPAWGMSELCGGVVHSTLRRDDETAGVVTVGGRATDGALTVLPAPAPGYPTYTEVGRPVRGTSVRVVGAGGLLPEDHVGRLQVRGVTLMDGYHNNPQADLESFTADGWFDTGDLAFVHEGRLVITGRAKDMIVIRSANYPCHEIESVVERVGGVLPTFAAACAEHDDESGTDELIVFCSLTEEGLRRPRHVADAVGAALSKEVGLRPRRVVPVPRERFPKTSAGKIERRRLLEAYQAGEFAEDPAAPAPGGDTAGWLSRTAWTPATRVPGPAPAGTWLVFGHGDLAERLRAERGGGGAAVVSVVPGPAYARRSRHEYQIDPADPAGYDKLLGVLRDEHGSLGALVHGWATARYAGDSEAYDRGLELSAPSVHLLIKACAGRPGPRLLVVTAGACPTGDADAVEPVHATVNGLVRTANAESGVRWVRQLDLGHGDTGGASAVPAVLAELGDAGDEEVVAYRAGTRLVPRLRPADGAPRDPAHRILPGGLYLMTGGLGDIGYRLARFLLAEHGVRLLLTGRSPAAGERAGRLARLAELGDVTYHQADVADAGALGDAVAAAERRYGWPLDGALHLAGDDISRYWHDIESHLLPRESTAEFHRMYRAKVHGTRALASVLDDRPGALLVLFSSVNGHFGGTAFGAYASASGFLPAFAEHRRRLGHPAQCHAWSLWAGTATSAGQTAAVERRGFRPIPPDHGVRLFTAALADPAAHVLIGLDHRNEHVARESGTSPAPAAARHDGAEPGGHRAGHPEPMGDTERAVAEVWRETLREPSVGREDHFFDLGGNSLNAIRLVDRLNAAFGTRLAVRHLYERPTVRELAEEIERDTARLPRDRGPETRSSQTRNDLEGGWRP
ncbi:SDR family NAD(P)-dependent oxidoreductase [Sphaerisporangium sp. B11E5]|uniref:SDR family NAD(P)-dependent oxidoreductase n=1 Tax=Sphaerisporangium sp. B11E5 TaxID=3153563 RepID=UPI00325DFBDC